MSRHFRLMLLVLSASVLVFGCGGDDNPVDPNPGPDPETGEYLKSLPTWEEVSPYQDHAVVETDTSTSCLDVVEDQRFLCVETPKSVTNTPDELITFNPAASILWPGALIQGRTYLGGLGTMQELPIRQRAPVTISIDILDQNNTRTVANPTMATVGSAVGELISAADALPNEFGSSVSYRRTEAYSLDQLSVDLGLSVKYLGGNARVDLSYDSTVE
jgi:hypothetical protein